MIPLLVSSQGIEVSSLLLASLLSCPSPSAFFLCPVRWPYPPSAMQLLELSGLAYLLGGSDQFWLLLLVPLHWVVHGHVTLSLL